MKSTLHLKELLKRPMRLINKMLVCFLVLLLAESVYPPGANAVGMAQIMPNPLNGAAILIAPATTSGPYLHGQVAPHAARKR